MYTEMLPGNQMLALIITQVTGIYVNGQDTYIQHLIILRKNL